MINSFHFLAPSLYPNTLVDIGIPEPGIDAPDPVVKHLAIKYGGHEAVGTVKALAERGDGNVIAADDAYRLSVISMPQEESTSQPPEVTNQLSVKGKAGSVWAGLVPVQAGTIAGLSNGSLTLMPSTDAPIRSTVVPSPLTCLASSSVSSTQIAVAGREVDVGIYDVERLFAVDRALPAKQKPKASQAKLEDGQVWGAKNLPNTNLNLRVPVHHLALTFNPHIETSLYSGTKTGSVRHYDTRQRKPVSDWKLAREGGIGAISFNSASEHELFFADHSSLLGALDLRTGKMLYAISSPVSTHSITSFPPVAQSGFSRQLGMAAICSDASLRLFATTPSPEWINGEKPKGNWGEGKKGIMAGMVGGVGQGSFLFRGTTQVAERPKEKVTGEDAGEHDDEEEADDEDGEEVWDDLPEVGGQDSDDEEENEEDSWDEDSDDEVPKKKAKGKGGKANARNASKKAGKPGRGSKRR